MANPKHRISKSRRDKRRTHKKLPCPAMAVCPQCHELKLPHHVCLRCGQYKGETVIPVEEV